jgi:hypothetical protein
VRARRLKKRRDEKAARADRLPLCDPLCRAAETQTAFSFFLQTAPRPRAAVQTQLKKCNAQTIKISPLCLNAPTQQRRVRFSNQQITNNRKL